MFEPKPLPAYVINQNHDLADQVTSGSTRDNSPRPPSWRPSLIDLDEPLVTPADEESERPYHT